MNRLRMGGKEGGVEGGGRRERGRVGREEGEGREGKEQVPGTHWQSIMMARWKDGWISREQSTWDETCTKYNLQVQKLPQPP